MKEAGKVTHYYGKLGVAIIELSGDLQVGDRIKIQSKSSEFEQAIGSMEVDRQPVSSAKRGDTIGLKVEQKASEGSMVYKLEG